jgi:hypothetical protein
VTYQICCKYGKPVFGHPFSHRNESTAMVALSVDYAQNCLRYSIRRPALREDILTGALLPLVGLVIHSGRKYKLN